MKAIGHIIKISIDGKEKLATAVISSDAEQVQISTGNLILKIPEKAIKDIIRSEQ